MKFRLVENIYDGIDKRKKKKHSASPFMSYGFINVPYEVQMFNHLNGSDKKETASTELNGTTDGDGTSNGDCVNCVGD